MTRPKVGARVKNIAKPGPINANDAKTIANREISLRTFNPDFDQVIKRFSPSVDSGLRCGSPPGIVT